MDMAPGATTYGRWRSLEQLVEEHDGFLIDLDGVVYVGDEALPGAPQTIATLKERGKRVVFITNDPRAARPEYRARLAMMGVTAEEEEIVTAGYATASYLVGEERARGRNAFVIGSPVLHREIETVAINLVDADSDSADFVVVGGHEGFHYGELRGCCQIAPERGTVDCDRPGRHVSHA
jgi:glycerol-1-phosphatase